MLSAWEYFWSWAAASSSSTVADTVYLSGPSDGTVLQPSGVFTVQANGSISGVLVVTIINPGSTGLLSQTTFSLSSGAAYGTFIFTPNSVGNHVISETNNQSLSNFAALTFLAHGTGAGGGSSGLYRSLDDEYWANREAMFLANTPKPEPAPAPRPAPVVDEAKIAELAQLRARVPTITSVPELVQIAKRINELEQKSS